MKKYYLTFLAIFIILGISTPSNAMNFTWGDTGSLEFGGIGFGDYSVKTLMPNSFSLDEGDSRSFNLFDVRFKSVAGGFGTAILNLGPFKDDGIYLGGHLGNLLFGSISWGAPLQIDYNGGTLGLDLNDTRRFGVGSSFIISGTIKNIKNPTSVPEPGAMLSLGIVLLGLVAVSRKRFNKRV